MNTDKFIGQVDHNRRNEQPSWQQLKKTYHSSNYNIVVQYQRSVMHSKHQFISGKPKNHNRECEVNMIIDRE